MAPKGKENKEALRRHRKEDDLPPESEFKAAQQTQRQISLAPLNRDVCG
jgi:hypothetical protein